MHYPTTEHAYQAAKIADPDIKAEIRDCATPAEAKDYLEAHHIRPGVDWTVEKKLGVMEQLQMIKFGGKEPLLTRALLATGDAPLIESNTWDDTFWGVCNQIGENNLGKILMKIREELLHQRKKIIYLIEQKAGNSAIANELSISQKSLYEKMNAFSIQNKEYWIT